jgi:GT2 family glycosyltransferase
VLANAEWGRFDLRFDEAGPLLRLIARLISWRSRMSRVATGDQAIFVTREVFELAGGIRETELFEDVDLCRRLKRHGRMGVPRRRVVTSSRRWRMRGTWRTTLLMWTLKLLYLCGVPARRLARFYRNVR